MEKEFIQSDNYFVAESLGELPKVVIDNYVDGDDGGFKISTIVDSGNIATVYSKTIAQSRAIDNKKFKKHRAPDYEVYEIDVANKQVKIYKVKLAKVEALSGEDLSWYESRNEIEEETVGVA